MKKLLLLLCLLSSPLYAGVSYTMKVEDPSMPAQVVKGYVDSNGFKTDIEVPASTSVIFRKDKGLLWILNHADKTYMEMTPAQLTAMTSQMDTMMKQMEEQMKNMPPEARAQVEEMMKNKEPAKKVPVETTYKKIGSETIGAWAVDHYEGIQGATKIKEVWVATWDKLGITRGDMAVLESYGEFFKDFMKNTDSNDDFADSKKMFDTLGGFPIKTVTFEKGSAPSTSLVQDIKKENLDPNLFNLPAGYTKQASPMMQAQ